MKKITHSVLSISLLFTSFASSGCFGEFAAVRGVYGFNQNISDNKVVQTIVMYVLMIIPVYEVAGFIDVVLLNLIEFWTGSNPLAMKAGEIERQLVTFKGQNYEITATQNRYSVKVLDGKDAGKVSDLVFEPANSTWSVEAEGKSVAVCQLSEGQNGEIQAGLILPDGTVREFPVNDMGFALVRDYAAEATLTASILH